MAMNTGKWVGGDKWVMASRYGSRKSNSVTPRKGRSHYACGVDRAYLGDIQSELYASWKAKQR